MKGRIHGADESIDKSIASLAGEDAVFDERPDCYLYRRGVFPGKIACELLKQQGRPGDCVPSQTKDSKGIYQEFINQYDDIHSCIRGECTVKEILEQHDPRNTIMMEESYMEEDAMWHPNSTMMMYSYDENRAKRISNNDGVLVLQLFPHVRWTSRNPFTGKPSYMASQMKSTAEAMARRAQALADGAGDALTSVVWRTPLIAEDSSVTISVLLKTGQYNPTPLGVLWLEEQAVNPRWTHDPPIAPFIPNGTSNFRPTLAGAILAAFNNKRPYTANTVKADYYTNRCGAQWAREEKDIADKMYGPSQVDTIWPTSRVPYCYENKAAEDAAIANGQEDIRAAKDERPCILWKNGGERRPELPRAGAYGWIP
jgi:hypothetical protein